MATLARRAGPRSRRARRARDQRDPGPAPPTPLEDGVPRTLETFARLQNEGRLDTRELV